MELYRQERRALCEDGRETMLKTEKYLIKMNKLISKQGSSCITYEGEIIEEQGRKLEIPRLVIVKEFYPVSAVGNFAFTRDEKTHELHLHGFRDCAEYQERLLQFHKSYDRQMDFSNSKLMYTTVCPFDMETCGDSLYTLTQSNIAKPLDKQRFSDLESRMQIIRKMAELFRYLHHSGWIMLDFKPENFLWIDYETEKSIKVIDMDSFVNSSRLEEIKALSLNTRYSSPSMELYVRMVQEDSYYLDDLLTKRAYITKKENLYNVAAYMIEILGGDEGIDDYHHLLDNSGNLKEEEFLRIFRENNSGSDCSKNVERELFKVIRSALNGGYSDFDRFLEALDEVDEKRQKAVINNRKPLPKRNHMHVAYGILAEYPVFDYYNYDPACSENLLEVALIGSGSMREPMFKAVLSCVQMLNATLRIHLISEDITDFWRELNTEYQELKNTVWCYQGGERLEGYRVDENIVSQPLGEVHLYSDISGVRDKLHTINYIILTDEKRAVKEDSIQEILINKKGNYFLGTFYESAAEILNDTRIVETPLRDKKKTDLEKKIYSMGLKVHSYYMRERDPRISNATIEKEYLANDYFMRSSERTAVHYRYKLKSAGIDWNKNGTKIAAMMYYERVLSAKTGTQKKLFDELTALEHLSWEAFMILEGYVSVQDRQQLKQFVFEGENTWYSKGNVDVKMHPCIRSSHPGRGLSNLIWNTKNERLIQKLDQLDQWSIYIGEACNAKLEERKHQINHLFEEMKEITYGLGDDEIGDIFEALEQEKNGCLSRATYSSMTWREVDERLNRCIREKSIADNYDYRKLLNRLQQAEKLLEPALRLPEHHDFKYSDEDIIRALPRFLLGEEKITIIRPLGEETFENVFSSLLIQPARLMLISQSGKETDSEYKKCREFLKQRHLLDVEGEKSVLPGIRVEHQIIQNLKRQKTVSGWIDCTNCDDYRLIQKLKEKFGAEGVFRIVDRRIEVMDGEVWMEVYNRPLAMTIDEIFTLKNAKIRNNHEVVEKTLPFQYKALWSLYRQIKPYQWRILVHTLEELQETNRCYIDTKNRIPPKKIDLDVIDKEQLRNSRIKLVLEQLKQDGLIIKIQEYSLDDRINLIVTTNYTAIEQVIHFMINRVGNGEHRFVLEKEDGGNTIYVRDITRVISRSLVENQPDSRTNSDELKSDNIKMILKKLDETPKYKNLIFQHIHLCEKDNGVMVSFEYASDAIQKIFEKEGSILEVLIYQECKTREIFDDVRINVCVDWENGITTNELDVVGVKNSKSYFISAKMSVARNEHLYEIESMTKHFGNEGRAILVSSNLGSKYWTGEYAEGDKYISYRSRGSGIAYLSGKEVDCDNKIIIGSKIAELVTT